MNASFQINTSVTSTADFRMKTYIFMGSINIFCNYFVIFIAFSDRVLLKKSVLTIALAGGNSFDGMYKIARGLSSLLYDTDILRTTTVWACALEFRPAFQLIAFQAPAATLAAIGLERLTAVVQPAWYRRSCSWKTAVSITVSTYGYIVSVPLFIYFFDSWNRKNIIVDAQCDWRVIVDRRLNRYLHISSSVGGAFSVCCTLIALFACRRQMRKSESHNRIGVKVNRRLCRQLQLTKSMLCVAILDLLFVVTPNLIILLLPFIGVSKSAYSYIVFACLLCYCANSIPHPFVYLRFNSAFRKAAFSLIGGGSTSGDTLPGSKLRRST